MDKLSALSTINKRFTLNLDSYDSATSFSVLNQCSQSMSKLVLALYSPAHSERYAIKIKDDDYTRQILSAFLLANCELIGWIQLSAVDQGYEKFQITSIKEAINRSSLPILMQDVDRSQSPNLIPPFQSESKKK